MAGFFDDLVHGEGDAHDAGVIPGEAAVGAVIDALVGDVEGGKEAHGAAEIAPGDEAGLAGHGLELGGGFGVQEAPETLHEGRLARGEGIEDGGEGGQHEGNLS